MNHKLTKDQAWKQALDRAVEHHHATSRKGKSSLDDNMKGLYTGVRVIREKIEADTLRSNDLVQLIACALDCLGAGLYDASQRGEKPEFPPGVS